MSDTILGDIEAILSADKGPILTVAAAIVEKMIPAILEALAGGETAPQIAAPYVKGAWDFFYVALSSLASGAGEAAVLAAIDNETANVIEGIRFGTKVP